MAATLKEQVSIKHLKHLASQVSVQTRREFRDARINTWTDAKEFSYWVKRLEKEVYKGKVVK